MEEADVRREDQLKINEFGRLNAKLHERRSDRDALRKMIEEMEDATTELAMGDGQNVKLMLGGEAFLEVDEDYANEYCETMQEKLQADMEEHNAAIGKIETRQKVLKADLYARFGTSINLEEK